jgi:hypothetical protein
MIYFIVGAALGVIAFRRWRRERAAERYIASRFVFRPTDLQVEIMAHMKARASAERAFFEQRDIEREESYRYAVASSQARMKRQRWLKHPDLFPEDTP